MQGKCWSSTVTKGPWIAHDISFPCLVLSSPLLTHTFTCTILPHMSGDPQQIPSNIPSTNGSRSLKARAWKRARYLSFPFLVLSSNLPYMHAERLTSRACSSWGGDALGERDSWLGKSPLAERRTGRRPISPSSRRRLLSPQPLSSVNHYSQFSIHHKLIFFSVQIAFQHILKLHSNTC